MKILYKLMALAFFCTLFSCKHSAKIIITGVTDSCKGTIVKLLSKDFKTTYASTVIRNKRFIMIADLPEDGFYNITFSNHKPGNGFSWAHTCEFFAEKGAKYQFSAAGVDEILSNRYDIKSSSADQTKFNDLNRLVSLKTDIISAKRKYYLKKADEALSAKKNTLYKTYSDSIDQTNGTLYRISISAMHQFIHRNPNTVISPYLIIKAGDMFDNYTFYKNALNALSKEVKASKYYDEANSLLQAANYNHVGAKAPQLYGKDLNGNGFKLNYAGKKIILLDFWQSQNPTWRAQLPALKAFYGKYKNTGLEIVSVSVDADSLEWSKASRQYSIPWYNIAELANQTDSKNIKNFAIKSIPTNYVLNAKGEFIARNVGLDSLDRIMKAVK